MQRAAFITVIIWVFHLSLSAQVGTVVGTVQDDSVALEYVRIKIEKTNLITVSDSSGNFEIKNIPFGTYKVTSSQLGYETQITNIVLNESSSVVRLEFKMNEIPTDLNETVVSGTMMDVVKSESAVNVEI